MRGTIVNKVGRIEGATLDGWASSREAYSTRQQNQIEKNRILSQMKLKILSYNECENAYLANPEIEIWTCNDPEPKACLGS